MKKKFLILTLCFTLFFTSLNYKKSYALDFVVSPTLFATVVGLGVATGLSLNNDIEMYDFVNNFIYNSKKSIDEMNELLTSCVVLGVGGALTVGKEFIDFFNDTMSSSQGHFGSSDVVVNSNLIGTYNGINIHDFDKFISEPGSYSGLLIKSSLLNSKTNFTVGNASFKYNKSFNGLHSYDVTVGSYTSNLTYNPSTFGDCRLMIGKYTNGNNFYYTAFILSSISNPSHYSSSNILTNSLPSSYVGGFDYDYSNDKIKDNQNEDGSVGIYVPGNLGDFVGTFPGSNVGTNENDWVGVGSSGVIIPGVDNPSVNVEGDITFPGSDVLNPPSDIPSDTPFANITDYIISLVVPSDTYWTDTWGGLYNNFISSFPMVDMGGFNKLAVNGKPFPNIDITIMGSKGRIVNGDTVNSIVDWLRPIVAGFVFLCLMFFNYRKLYKLIRNSEPFEGIGKVENHAN